MRIQHSPAKIITTKQNDVTKQEPEPETINEQINEITDNDYEDINNPKIQQTKSEKRGLKPKLRQLKRRPNNLRLLQAMEKTRKLNENSHMELQFRFCK